MQVNEYKPLIVAFCCNWCSYAGADLAGNNRLNYPADVKIIYSACIPKGRRRRNYLRLPPGRLPLHFGKLLYKKAYGAFVLNA